MYYGNIKKYDIANGEGVRISLFVSGCTNHCKNCFQPETWDFAYGKPYTKETEAEIADRLDKIPDTLKADGYPDVQVFMRTFREMESVVEQYNHGFSEWEYQVSRKPTATAKEQHRPPEKQSVLKHLREIQERNKQKTPQRQRKKSIDRDSR